MTPCALRIGNRNNAGVELVYRHSGFHRTKAMKSEERQQTRYLFRLS